MTFQSFQTVVEWTSDGVNHSVKERCGMTATSRRHVTDLQPRTRNQNRTDVLVIPALVVDCSMAQLVRNYRKRALTAEQAVNAISVVRDAR